MRKNGVRCLLMGGQACVFYGAAEFSRDLDLFLFLEDANLDRFRKALNELEAVPIAVPRLSREVLVRGHAVHFRCRRPDMQGLRVDVMSRLRSGPSFDDLWARRTTIETGGETVDLLSLPDLVLAKKTQRDKDWPMIRRLVERSYFTTENPTPEAVDFWLRELRSPELLVEAAGRFPDAAALIRRAALQAAVRGNLAVIEECLLQEERLERAADQVYWQPLIRELEQFRRIRRDS